MKFGSRMDVVVPRSANVIVKEGDKVVAGESIIAKLAIQ
ncbi:MAG: Phosphatidylserine decarboxylase proenzyme [Rhodothermaeota bacterium MED-G12]|nr:MAG: Phosphatidylserine decarboxylase proenzyme [Rhodothermaeota bacterium MED-G12]